MRRTDEPHIGKLLLQCAGDWASASTLQGWAMRVTMITTRLQGVARERGKLASSEAQDGDLEIVETRDGELKRFVKVARLTTLFNTYELVEAQIIWINEDKICLSGFERINRNGRLVDYAQSWVCAVLNQQRDRKRTPSH
jgi:hypothetical protein